ncbi:MAG: DUF4177 domain-containing protein [Clostridiales bacterium]|nr:DUF4177 domain-containing protein [Clostridiales bacterium]
MYEYKVLTLVKDLEKELNQYAKEGWRLVSAMPSSASGYFHAVLEREVDHNTTNKQA